MQCDISCLKLFIQASDKHISIHIIILLSIPSSQYTTETVSRRMCLVSSESMLQSMRTWLLVVLSAVSVLVSHGRDIEVLVFAIVFDFWATIGECDLPLLCFGSIVWS